MWWLSVQPIDEQAGFAEWMQIPFPLLNDAELLLASPPLNLPTFEADGMQPCRRVTLIVDA